MTRVSGRAERGGRRREALPNALAIFGAGLLFVFGVPALALAYAMHRAFVAGEQQVATVRANVTQTIDANLDGILAAFAKFAYSLGEDTTLRWPRELDDAASSFRFVIAATLIAALVAAVTAVRLRTDERWPERVWVAAAVLALIPGFVATPWLPMAIPSIACFTLATGLHFTLRRKLGSRSLAVIAPHAGKVIERGTGVASSVGEKAAGSVKAVSVRLPEARNRVVGLGRLSAAVAAPVIGTAAQKLRGGPAAPAGSRCVLRPQGPDIALGEWQAYADGAGDLRLEGAIEHTDPVTGEAPRTQAVWMTHPEQRAVTFHYTAGVIVAALPDEATIARLGEIAGSLGACVQSGDSRLGEAPALASTSRFSRPS